MSSDINVASCLALKVEVRRICYEFGDLIQDLENVLGGKKTIYNMINY